MRYCHESLSPSKRRRTMPDVFPAQNGGSPTPFFGSHPPKWVPFRRRDSFSLCETGRARMERSMPLLSVGARVVAGPYRAGRQRARRHGQLDDFPLASIAKISIMTTVIEPAGAKMPLRTVESMASSRSEKPTVRGGRKPNGAFRPREFLHEDEIEKLRKAARKNRNRVRDELLVLLAYRHALRVSELVSLTVDQFDLKAATVHVRRAKNGTPGIHGLGGDELRLIRQLIRDNGEHSRFLFLSERKAPLSIDGAQKLIERLGEAANLPFPIHVHMLRHSAGYALAGRGVDTRTLQAFMGHKSIANTVIYTAVADKRIRHIWDL
jgi:integrase